MTRIWNIKYDDGRGNTWTEHNVVANNVNEAIKKSQSLRKGEYYVGIHYIKSVELIAEASN